MVRVRDGGGAGALCLRAGGGAQDPAHGGAGGGRGGGEGGEGGGGGECEGAEEVAVVACGEDGDGRSGGCGVFCERGGAEYVGGLNEIANQTGVRGQVEQELRFYRDAYIMTIRMNNMWKEFREKFQTGPQLSNVPCMLHLTGVLTESLCPQSQSLWSFLDFLFEV